MEKPSSTMHLLEFECRGQRIGLPLECVKRAVPAAEPEPLPGTEGVVLGALNIGGEPVVVVDMARRLGLGAAAIDPSQQLLVVELSGYLAAVVVDRIAGVTARDTVRMLPDALHGAPFVAGMVRLDDGLCLVLDAARFLFDDEREMLEQALAGELDDLA
jgi:purine-binding chemotaxis protein CheW